VIEPNRSFKAIMTKSNSKKSVMTSFQWHYYNFVTEKRHQTSVIKCSHFCPSTQLNFLAAPIIQMVRDR